MKKRQYFGLLISVAMVLAGCGQSTNKQGENPNELSSTERMQESSPQKESSPMKTKLHDYIGTYKVVDKYGKTFYFILNDDKTVQIKDDNDRVAYCWWEDFSPFGFKIGYGDERPRMFFEGGESTNYASFLDPTGGWLYEELNYLQAKHPRWRLKAEKIK